MRPRHPYQVRDPEALKECLRSTQRVVPHSVRTLAAAVNRSSTTIGDLLTGKQTTVTKDLAVGLSAILGRPLDDLFFLTSSSESADTDKGVEISQGVHPDE